MEIALRYELNTIPEIENKLFPTNAPQGKKPPYVVYMKSNFQELKTFEGIQNNVEVRYMLNVLHSSYEMLYHLTEKIRKHLHTFPLRSIGEGGIYVQDMTINNLAETYENELKLYRTIIDVTFWYKEDEK